MSETQTRSRSTLDLSASNLDLAASDRPLDSHSVPGNDHSTRLRVGLLIESLYQPEWISNIIRDIRASSTSEVAAVILRDVHAAPVTTSTLWANRHNFLYSLYSKLDRWLFSTSLDPLADADVSPFIDGCRQLRVGSPNGCSGAPFSDQDAERIRAEHLDVVLDFGRRAIRGSAAGVAKYGVWAYQHSGDEASKGLIGFWEVMEERPVTSSQLYAVSEQPGMEKVIYHSSGRTHPRSVRRNRTGALSKASAFTIRKLRDLYEDGPAALEARSPDTAGGTGSINRDRPLPTNREMLRLLSGLVSRYVASRLKHYVRTEQWFLAFSLQQSHTSGGVPLRAPDRMTPILPPKDRFWADPFAVKREGGYYVFFEERPSVSKRGFLSVLEIDDTGLVGDPTKVLERDYHLSYPFVFDWDGHYFMVPESAANKTVELYRATQFPYRWELDCALLKEVNAVDATIHWFENRWWMFVNIALPGASSCDELHIYHAESPRGPWLPHRRNPLKSDARNSRPAGRIFMHSGDLYRPAQDCSIRYGGSIIINKIVRLDLNGFDEVEVSTILPDWLPNLVATHTINRVDRLTVMDAKWTRPRWWR